jgi:hypothetical protein
VTPDEIPDADLSAAYSIEGNRQGAALNHLLGEIGLTRNEQTSWWNLVAQLELGNRTATQAWLDGDTLEVRALVERCCEKSESAVGRVTNSPEFLAMLRQKISEIGKRLLGNDSVRQCE